MKAPLDTFGGGDGSGSQKEDVNDLKDDDKSQHTAATDSVVSQEDMMEQIGAVCYDAKLPEDEKGHQIKAIVSRQKGLSDMEKEAILRALIPKQQRD